MCVAYRMWFTGGSGVAPHIKMSHFTLSNWKTTLVKGVFCLRRIILGAVEAILDKIAVISLSTRLQRLHYSKMAHFATPALNVNFSRFAKAECCLVISVGDPSPPPQPAPPQLSSCCCVGEVNWNEWPTCQCQVTQTPSLCVYGRPEQHLAPGGRGRGVPLVSGGRPGSPMLLKTLQVR